MTSNYFISCNVCGTVINIRAQIGYYDIPFNIYCPKCRTHIHGKVEINQEKIEIAIQLENATIDNSIEKPYKKMYCAEISSEFPASKMYIRDFNANELPPFIKNMTYYENDDEAVKATENAMLFTKHFPSRWKEIKLIYELFWNKKSSLLYPKLEDELGNYDYMSISKVINDFDACMVLHQLLITTTGLTRVLNQGELDNYIRVSKLVSQNVNIINQVHRYTQSSLIDYNNIEKKAFKLIDTFAVIYEYVIPVVALKKSNNLSKVDKKKYGIMPNSFEELTKFYANSYEWILDNIDIVIALNNIVTRNNSNDCFNSKTLDSLTKIGSKYRKLDYLNGSEKFSPPIMSLKNSIRNSIQHSDCEINYETQEVIFNDNHRGKTRQVKMYLLEFVDLCLENFSVIFYILELVYNLRKASYQSVGLKPSFIVFDNVGKKNEKKSKKTGRNEPCPCGSGKKYKKCCI